MEPLFFFFGKSNYAEIKLEITFEGLKGKNTSMEDFNEFMISLEEIHKAVIINTQPEYHTNNKTYSAHNNTVILEYNKLKIEKLCRNNPFTLVLTFFIFKNGIASYWIFMKFLVKMCKRYGKDTDKLLATIETFKTDFIRLYDKFYIVIPFSKELNLFADKNKLYEKINISVYRLLSNKEFSKHYNTICNTTITITNFISHIEDNTDEVISYIEGDK
jgi:hypothetical protein